MKPVETSEREHPRPLSAGLLGNKMVAWALLVAGFLVLARLAFRGWIPYDEGTLGQAASRVLAGEVPHLDFHDTYGGLQAYAHAGVFQLLGESVRSLRIANLAIAAIAGYSSFTLVRRVQPVVVAASAAVATWLVAFAVYPASLPSWWNSAFGLAAVCLVLRWVDSRNNLVLASAGLITGVSFLVKSTGIYVGVAIGLYLLMLASLRSPRRWGLVGLGYGIALAFGVLLTSAPSMQAFVVLWVPLITVVFVGFRAVPISLPLDHPPVSLWPVVVFSASALVPVVLFVSPYLWSGNADELVTGWIRLPRLRFDDAAWAVSVPQISIAVLASLALIIYWANRRLGWKVAQVATALLIVLIAVFDWTGWWGLAVILIVLTPLIVSAGILQARWGVSLTNERLLCALALAGFAFNQFPVSNRIYGLYLFPLAVIAVAVWMVGSRKAWAITALLLLTASIVAIQLERGYLYVTMPLTVPVELVPLDVDRGGIQVPVQHHFYVELVDHLEGRRGSAIYAGPDAPEIYFLSATVNPTPVLFDFLADDWSYDELAELIADGGLSALALNRTPDFSAQLPQGLLEIIQEEYPNRTSFGWFDVYEDLGGGNE